MKEFRKAVEIARLRLLNASLRLPVLGLWLAHRYGVVGLMAATVVDGPWKGYAFCIAIRLHELQSA